MDRGIFVRNSRLICYRYTTGGALVDVISSLPITAILYIVLPPQRCSPNVVGNYSDLAQAAHDGVYPVVDDVFHKLMHEASINASAVGCDMEFAGVLPTACYVACNDSAASLLGRANRLIRLIRLSKLIRVARLTSYLRAMFDLANLNPGLFRRKCPN